MIPTEVNIDKKSAVLELGYEDGTNFRLPAELLRVYSPSAEVQGHSADQAVLQTGKKHVQFLDIETQGNYAIKITFSDGHDSGIFSWDFLYELGSNQSQYWQDYLDKLSTAGASREPQFIAAQ